MSQILTEEEAKTKWCPLARTAIYSGSAVVAVNRALPIFKLEAQTCCIASACMAWAPYSDGLAMKHFTTFRISGDPDTVHKAAQARIKELEELSYVGNPSVNKIHYTNSAGDTLSVASQWMKKNAEPTGQCGAFSHTEAS